MLFGLALVSRTWFQAAKHALRPNDLITMTATIKGPENRRLSAIIDICTTQMHHSSFANVLVDIVPGNELPCIDSDDDDQDNDETQIDATNNNNSLDRFRKRVALHMKEHSAEQLEANVCTSSLQSLAFRADQVFLPFVTRFVGSCSCAGLNSLAIEIPSRFTRDQIIPLARAIDNNPSITEFKIYLTFQDFIGQPKVANKLIKKIVRRPTLTSFRFGCYETDCRFDLLCHLLKRELLHTLAYNSRVQQDSKGNNKMLDFAHLIANNKTITTLNLHKMSMDEQANLPELQQFKVIFGNAFAVGNNSTVRRLGVNNFMVSTELFEALGTNSTITALKLKHLRICHLEQLIRLIDSNKTITSYSLDITSGGLSSLDNKSKDELIDTLFGSLAKNTALMQLKLHISGTKKEEKFINMVAKTDRLLTLDIFPLPLEPAQTYLATSHTLISLRSRKRTHQVIVMALDDNMDMVISPFIHSFIHLFK
ncbi:hypothetical protein SAMD00019534_035910 [Acytostelium subglobosum LB1]|uniref:hypothetical protein n=1 Tax=Acytostelium subglobosum LB1 TaxID=1410327 RepID=UPI000645119A|nr:hypothetical protein SAMD00019534_035910 [Acytostelium subglobosum LB1]GAM20416.1 hypothetical protein SAMD00019534_035910 [Acytostelium subglobosum LB1]|eukprot:XP_012759937.1 hypothetical protein SAMD00019534_035910 [Acytostelium subglobosum LB1]